MAFSIFETSTAYHYAPTQSDWSVTNLLQFKSRIPVNIIHFIVSVMTTILYLRTMRLPSSSFNKGKSRSFWNSAIISAKASENPYTNTILLPKTKFPLRADAAKREHLFRDRCTKDLYPWQVNFNWFALKFMLISIVFFFLVGK